jgi:hypothetical protein
MSFRRVEDPQIMLEESHVVTEPNSWNCCCLVNSKKRRVGAAKKEEFEWERAVRRRCLIGAGTTLASAD